MSRISQHTADDGLQRIVMENDALRLSLIPEVGGKIHELVDRRSGFNWLWHHPRLRPTSALANAPFEESQDCGGWDEIVFSVTPTDLPAADGTAWSIPDHGTVVGRSWSVVASDTADDGSASVVLRAEGEAPPFQFDRKISIAPDNAYLLMEYELTNHSQSRLPGYWCAHPLFRVDEQTRIHLQGRSKMRVDHFSDGSVRFDDNQHWPSLRTNGTDDINLENCLGANRRFASKIYVETPADGAVSISRADGTQRLRLQFDPASAPWIGFWINRKGWSGSGDEPYFNLGIEPATAGFDDVQSGIDAGEVPWIEPGDTLRWSLQLELTA